MMSRVLSKLTRHIDAAWRRRKYDWMELADVAYEALSEHDLASNLTVEEVYRAALTSKLPRQLDPEGAFGQPPITLFNNGKFCVDAYLWVHSETSIHDHSFTGAFTNLAGNSFHCVYDFAEGDALGRDVCTGAVSLRHSEMLTTGSVCKIPSGRSFIHRVWHLSKPTVTITVRVVDSPRRVRQWEYLPPSLGIETITPEAPDIRKAQLMVRYLYRMRTETRDRHFVEAISNADVRRTCVLLRELLRWVPMREWAHRDGIRRAMQNKLGAHTDAVLQALEGEDALASVRFSSLDREEHRFVGALLLTHRRTEPIYEWLTRRYPDEDPRTFLLARLREMSVLNGFTIAMGEQHIDMLGCAERGLTANQTIRELKKVYAFTPRQRKELVSQYEQLEKLPVFAPLRKRRPAQSSA